MTLNLHDGKDLALLSEMLDETKYKCHFLPVYMNNPLRHRCGIDTGKVKCDKCDKELLNEYGKPLPDKWDICPYPDPITISMAELSWQVRRKMVEMDLLTEWEDAMPVYLILSSSTDWVRAGISVFSEQKKLDNDSK